MIPGRWRGSRHGCALGWGGVALVWLVATLHTSPGGVRYGLVLFNMACPLLVGAVGLWQLLALLRRFRLTVDGDGLVVQVGRRTHRLEWSEIASIEVVPGLEPKRHARWRQAILVLWPATRRRFAGLAPHHADGRVGHILLGFNDFKEPPSRVIKTLQRHGGEKINAREYLDYLESRRQFAAYLRNLDAEIEARKDAPGNPTT